VRTITSELLRIPGIGDSKRRRLLTAFGSIQAIREATPEQIAEVPGFSVASGRKIIDALRASDALAPAPTAPMSPEASPTPEAHAAPLNSHVTDS
jgi:excinuclease ABC subunit C